MRSSMYTSRTLVNELYWISDHPDLLWAPGQLQEHTAGGGLRVKCIVDDQEFALGDQAVTVHPSCTLGVGNLLELGEFTEGALLHSIRTRFHRQ